MLERLQSMNEAATDIAKVWTVNVGAIVAGWIMSVNGILTTVSLALGIAYTIWRWRREARKGK